MSDTEQPYFDPDYKPTAEELQGESWAACYGQPVIVLPPEPIEPDHEHH